MKSGMNFHELPEERKELTFTVNLRLDYATDYDDMMNGEKEVI